MTPEQLAEIKARAEAATPGPWEWEPTKRGTEWDEEERGAPYIPQGAMLGNTLIQLADTYENSRQDCKFIAHARADISALVEEVTRLQDELKVTDQLLNERNRLLAAIPECPQHGQCVPHAIEWVEQTQAEVTHLRAALVAIQGEMEEEEAGG